MSLDIKLVETLFQSNCHSNDKKWASTDIVLNENMAFCLKKDSKGILFLISFEQNLPEESLPRQRQGLII